MSEFDIINGKLDDILRRLKALEDAKIQQVPYPTTDGVYRCPTCGMTFGQVSGYVCSRMDCPAFNRISCVSTYKD